MEKRWTIDLETTNELQTDGQQTNYKLRNKILTTDWGTTDGLHWGTSTRLQT